MSTRKNEKRVMTGLVYTIILLICFTLLAGVTLFAILLNAYPYEAYIGVIITILCIAMIVGCITIGLFVYQVAIFTDKAIIFKGVFGTIAIVECSKIVKIAVESTSALYSLTMPVINKKWIVIYTDLGQKIRNGEGNKKNNPPYKIRYSGKNIRIIKDYCKKYCVCAQVKLE
jgi:hypothetical protein